MLPARRPRRSSRPADPIPSYCFTQLRTCWYEHWYFKAMREAYAELVFGFLRYFRENNIDKNDINNPIVKIFNITLDIYKNIYSLRYNTLEAMNTP